MNPYESPSHSSYEVHSFRSYWAGIATMISLCCLVERLYWNFSQWHLYAQWYRNQCSMVLCMMLVVVAISFVLHLSESWKIQSERSE